MKSRWPQQTMFTLTEMLCADNHNDIEFGLRFSQTQKVRTVIGARVAERITNVCACVCVN